MPEQNEPKLVPCVDNPLLHISDHDLSRRIAAVAFESMVQVGVSNATKLEAVYEPGERGVASIWQTSPAIAGAVWYIDIVFEDGRCQRRFNPKWIEYAPDPSLEIKIKLSDEKPG